MLRRGEIASVKKDGIDYSVEELLKDGSRKLSKSAGMFTVF